MQQNISQPKKQLRSKHKSEKSSGFRKQNNFDLISSFPKRLQYEVPFDDEIDNIEFAENCISFLKEVFPSRYDKLFFYPELDDLASFIGKLIDEVTKNFFMINYFDQTYESNDGRSFDKNNFSVLYPVPWYDQQWFVLEAKNILNIPLLLRPAYAHLLYKYSLECDPMSNFLGSEYEDGNDCPFGDCEWIIDSMICEKDVQPEDEDARDEMENEIQYEILSFYQEKKSIVDKYYKYNWETIYRFIPRNENDTELKNLLIEGLTKINFKSIGHFANDRDYHEECFVPYQDCFMVWWDTNYNAEAYMMQMNNDRSHNGGCSPMGFYNMRNNEISSKTEPNSVIQFGRVQDFICELYGLLEENYKSKFKK